MIKNPAESRRIAEALSRDKLTLDERQRVQRASLAVGTIDELDPEIRALLVKAER